MPNTAFKCPHCQRVFFDIGSDICPYCHKNIKEFLNDIFGKNNPFNQIFGEN